MSSLCVVCVCGRVGVSVCVGGVYGSSPGTRCCDAIVFKNIFVYLLLYYYSLRYYYLVCCTLLLFHSSYLLVHAFSFLTFLCCVVVTNILIWLWSAVLHFFTEGGSCIATETFELSQKGFWLV